MAEWTIQGLPKNCRYEGDVLGLAEPHGTACKMLGTTYSNFIAIAMKFLTFADLFFFFLWKTRRAKINNVSKPSARTSELASEQGIELLFPPTSAVMV